jgi:hypothetical protein
VATYLDVLVELLTDPDGRAAYVADPPGWLRAAGVGFLCGEDVVAAGPIISAWVPDLGVAYDQLAGTDPQPALGETELDAAVRVLGVLVEKVSVTSPADSRFG